MSDLRLWPRCSPLGGRGSQTPTSLPSPWQVSVPNLVALTETEWYKRKHGFQKSEPRGRFSGYSESNYFQTDMQWKFDPNPTEQARCFPLSRRLWKDHAWCDQLTTDEFQYSLKFQAVKFQVLTSGLHGGAPSWPMRSQTRSHSPLYTQFVVSRSLMNRYRSFPVVTEDFARSNSWKFFQQLLYSCIL